MKINKNIILGLILLFIIGCSQKKDIKSLKFSGTLEMLEHSLGAPVPGRVKEILVEEGQNLKKGQIIAYLEHYDQAKRDFSRDEELVGVGGVSKEEYEHDKQAMEDQQVVSPIDGLVLLKILEDGEVAAAGTPIVIIGDPLQLWIRVYIPEDLINQISMHQKAHQ